MSDLSNVRINGQRLWDTLMEMAQIGGTPKGGCKRLTLTDLDKQGRELFRRWCEKEGCTVKVDEMGNMFARRAGVEDDLPPVMMGSHLDTQPTGGKFDGVLGVLGALEVVRSLNDLKIETRRPIVVVNWTNEEGSRFAPAMVSSGVFAGVFPKEFAYSRVDADGKTLGAELERIGFKGEEPIGGWPIHAAFELHIEQGPILEDESIDVGVVTHGQGQRWYEIRLTGFESHAGSTPMPRRKDALLGAARIVELVNAIGLSKAPLGVSTVGMLNPYPNSRNVIPGEVFMTCEFRHPIDATLTEMDAAVARRASRRSRRRSASTYDLKQVFYYRAGRLRRGMCRRRAPRNRTFRLFASRHRFRRRARRLLPRARRADVDDLHALRRRRQPQRERRHQDGMVDRRRERADARGAGEGGDHRVSSIRRSGATGCRHCEQSEAIQTKAADTTLV